MSNSGREVREMKVMLYCSLSESGLSNYSDVFSREIFPANYLFLVDILHSVTKILALWMDGTVSYVALDSVLQHYIELVMEAALLPLSMVQEMIQEWMGTMVPEVEDVDGTSYGVLPEILAGFPPGNVPQMSQRSTPF